MTEASPSTDTSAGASAGASTGNNPNSNPNSNYVILEHLLEKLLMADNQMISEAETQMNEFRKSDPNGIIQGLSHLVGALYEQGKTDLSSLAAVLLRRKLIEDETTIYRELAPHVQHQLKETMLQLARHVRDQSILTKVSNIISVLGMILLESGEWPELLQFMFASVTGQDMYPKLSALKVFSALSYYIATNMTEHFDQITAILYKCLLPDENPTEIRVEAMRAATNLFIVVETPSIRHKLIPITPQLLVLVKEQLSIPQPSQDDQKQQVELLELLVNVCEVDAPVFRGQLQDLVTLMCQVINDGVHFESSTRVLAMEVMLCIAERSGGMVRKMHPFNVFLKMFIPPLLSILANVADYSSEETQRWSQTFANVDGTEEGDDEDDYGDPDQNELIVAVLEAFDRIGVAVGRKLVVPTTFPLISQLLGSGLSQRSPLLAEATAHSRQMELLSGIECPVPPSDSPWKGRYAGLATLSRLVELLTGKEPQLGMTASVVIQFATSDPEPRVRDQALHTIARMAWDCDSRFSRRHHGLIIPGLVNRLDDPLPRLQAQAALAMMSFIDNMDDKKELEPYLQLLLTKLFDRLQNGPKCVQETTLLTVGCIADRAGKLFRPYYQQTYPLLRDAYMSLPSDSKEYHLLRVRALECMAIIVQAVGKKCCGEDASYLAQLVAQAGRTMSPSDPQRYVINQIWKKLAETLKSDIAPFIQDIMPAVLELVAKEVNFGFEGDDEDDDAAEEGGNDDLEQKVLASSEAIEEKAELIGLIGAFAKDTGEAFFPFLESAFSIINTYCTMEGSPHDHVRSSAIATVSDLIGCAAKHFSFFDQQGRENVRKLMLGALQSHYKGLESEDDLDLVKTLVQSIQHCIENSLLVPESEIEQAKSCLSNTDALSDEQLSAYMSTMLKVMRESFQRRGVYIAKQRTEAEDVDEDEAEKLTMEIEEEHELHYIVADSIGKVALYQPNNFVKVFQEVLLNTLLDFAHPNRLASDKKFTVFVFDDLVDHLGGKVEPMLHHIVQVLIPSVVAEDESLQQAAIYGLGSVAEHFGEATHPGVLSDEQLHNIMQHLYSALNAFTSEEAKDSPAFDNLISTMAKLARHFPGKLDVREITRIWLSNLPLRNDRQEAKLNTLILLERIERGDNLVLGDQWENTPQIAHILLQTIGSESIAPTLNKRALNVVEKIKPTLLEGKFQELVVAIGSTQLENVKKAKAEAEAEAEAETGPDNETEA